MQVSVPSGSEAHIIGVRNVFATTFRCYISRTTGYPTATKPGMPCKPGSLGSAKDHVCTGGTQMSSKPSGAALILCSQAVHHQQAARQGGDLTTRGMQAST